MSSVSLTLHQTSTPLTVDGGATYKVVNEVTASMGIAMEVFVFRTDTGVFSHYATPADLELLPTSQAVAVSNSVGFFRQSSVTRIWTKISEMNEDLALTKTRLQALSREVAKTQGTLLVDQVVEIRAD
jgi:hypothetical protein